MSFMKIMKIKRDLNKGLLVEINNNYGLEIDTEDNKILVWDISELPEDMQLIKKVYTVEEALRIINE